MQRSVGEIAKFGELRLREALEAIKAHKDAKDGGAPTREVERLRLLADELYEAVIEYRLMLSGNLSDPSIGIAAPAYKEEQQ